MTVLNFLPCRSRKPRTALIATATGFSLLFAGLPSAAADELPTSGSNLPASGSDITNGPSDDIAAIAEAADAYIPGDADSAVGVAEAAAANVLVPLTQTGPETSVAVTSDATVQVGLDGRIVLQHAQAPTVGFNLDTAAADVGLVDGAVVATGAAPSLDLITRATDAGVQVVAVLADERAPTDIGFPLNLPEGAELIEQSDGTISVVADVETEVALPGEEARIEAAALAILGGGFTSLDDLDILTDARIEELASIPDARTKTVAVKQQITQIAAPWAVDANGRRVPTHYTLDGDTLVQSVEVTAETAFPVVADPSLLWWIEKGAKCLGGVVSLGALGYAKVAVAIAKLVVKMKAASLASKLGKAYAAWKRLGTSDSARFSGLVAQIKALANKVVKYGYPGIAKHKASSTKAAASITLIKEGAAVVAGVFGLGACYSMLTA